MAFVLVTLNTTSVNDAITKIEDTLISAGWTVAAAGPPRVLVSAADAAGRRVYVAFDTEVVGTTTYIRFRLSASVNLTLKTITAGVNVPHSGTAFPKSLRMWASEFFFIVNPTTATGASDGYPFAGGLVETPPGSDATNQPYPYVCMYPRDPATTTSAVIHFPFTSVGTNAGRYGGIDPAGNVVQGNQKGGLTTGADANSDLAWTYGTPTKYTLWPCTAWIAAAPPALVGTVPGWLMCGSYLPDGATIQVGSAQYKAFDLYQASANKKSLLVRVM
jgi:hypothetical protein